MRRTVFELAGVLRGVYGALAWAPQVIKTWQRKSARDISAGLLLMATASLTSFLAYGIAFGLVSLLVGVAVQLALVLVVITLKLRYDRPPSPSRDRA